MIGVFVALFLILWLCPELRRWLGRIVRLVVCVVALVISVGWRRATGVDDRRRDWRRAHAAACRERAAEYRARGSGHDKAAADLMDRLANDFDGDAVA
jgi:4-amino-4-deoxy-L-arabinose transferase-like glycosyltransferase